MKKLALFLVLMVSSNAFAQQADYGGIWRASVDPGTFVIVTQRGSSLVMAALASDGMWDAYIGSISGQGGTVSTAIGRVSATYRLRFVSSQQVIATLESCTPTPLWTCLSPVGTQITYNKIF